MENTDLIILSPPNLLTCTKADIANLVSNVCENLNDGLLDHAQALVVGKKLEELFKQYNEAVRQLSKGKIKLHKGESYITHGVEITEAETGVKYDYSKCNDSEWNSLTEKIEPLIELRKSREKFLQSIRKDWIDEETGEVINPPLRTGSTSYKLTFKK